MLDLSKPVQTRDGRPARVLCTDLKGRYPLAVAITVEGEEHMMRRRADGTAICGYTETDIVNVPPKKLERWVNVYPSGAALSNYATRDEADTCARPNRVRCIHMVEADE